MTEIVIPNSQLSTGQTKPMMLLAKVLKKTNFLFLDEPKNYLGFITLKAFEKALLEFQGAILIVKNPGKLKLL